MQVKLADETIKAVPSSGAEGFVLQKLSVFARDKKGLSKAGLQKQRLARKSGTAKLSIDHRPK